MQSEELLKKVKRIEIISRKISREVFAGAYHSTFKGRGMEFASVREYAPGDDIRFIDWNVSSRMGRLHVKQFVEERELTLMLALDLSSSMFFFSNDLTKREVMAEIAAIIAFAANYNNDKVGLMLFSDQVEKYIPPRKGRQHILRIIRDILEFQPAGRKTDLQTGVAYLSRVLKKKSILMLFSDFIDTGFDRALKLAGSKHDLILMRFTDPRERSLPHKGLYSLEDCETGQQIIVDLFQGEVRNRFAAWWKEKQSELKDLARKYRIDEIEFSVGKDYERPLMKFFNERKKRIGK